jgi:glycosidase
MIDPYAGSLEDLRRLCDEAHKMGMKVILDAVFNHTGNDSKYFNEFNSFPELGAYQSRDSKYFPFYRKFIANNHVYFDYWWGMKNLPVCDGNSKIWQDYIYGEGGIIDKWFSQGIDGLRLDVADELTDEFIEGIRRAVKRNKEDGFILGEVWKNPMRMNRGYIESGKGMDSVMNYPLINALIRYFKYGDINLLRGVIYELINEYPNDTLYSLMNFTSTHDITRAINIFSCNEFQYSGEWSWNLNGDDREYQRAFRLSKKDYELGKKIYAIYLYALAFLPGNLSIFYGDEIGMEGLGNLANRRPFSWDKQDAELLELVRFIGQIRNKEPYLEQADLKLVDVNERLLYFKRIRDEIESLTIINRTGDRQKLILPSDFEKEDAIYRLNNSTKKELNAYGGITLKKVR